MSTNADIKARLEALLEWTKKEVEDLKVSSSSVQRNTAEECDVVSSTDGKVCHFPSMEDTGVEEKLVRLCATMAGGVYQTTSKREFEKLLKNNPEINEAFPDLTLRFYQTGVTLGRMNSRHKASLNAPTLAGVIAGDTLVLAYRGTVTIADMIADIQMDSVQPWKEYQGLQVQGAYYKLIKDNYFGKKNSHKKDIINYINGNYSKVPTKTAKDGTPIKRILISGHSLGGGLAQVTHMCLTAHGGEFDDLVDAIQNNHVQVKTVAFSAPMTTAIVDPSQETVAFLKDSIHPNMRNVCYRTDPVPRGYANLNFILDLLDDIKTKFMTAKTDDDNRKIQTLLSFLKEGLLPWALEFLEGKIETVIEQAKRYRHVGKVIYYDKGSASPEIYTDHDDGDDAKATFRGLPYTPSEDDPIYEAIQFHMFLVQEKGLGYLS